MAYKRDTGIINPFTTWDAPPGNLTKVDGDLDKGIN